MAQIDFYHVLLVKQSQSPYSREKIILTTGMSENLETMFKNHINVFSMVSWNYISLPLGFA